MGQYFNQSGFLSGRGEFIRPNFFNLANKFAPTVI